MWLAGNAGPKKSPKSRHLRTIAQLCRAISSQVRHISTIRIKLVKQQCLPQTSSPYGEHGPLAAMTCWWVWGTPANFDRFRVLAALLRGSQTLRHWTEGASYIRQSGHHVGHWPTFLVFAVLKLRDCGRFDAVENLHGVVCCRQSAHCAENMPHYHALFVYKIMINVYEHEIFCIHK